MIHDAREQFLEELCPQRRLLIASLMDCACGCEIADFFRGQPGLRIQAQDVAGLLQRPIEQVQVSLDRLTSLGILRRYTALDLSFYSLAEDRPIVAALEQFWLLRDARILELRQIEEALHLHRDSARILLTRHIAHSQVGNMALPRRQDPS